MLTVESSMLSKFNIKFLSCKCVLAEHRHVRCFMSMQRLAPNSCDSRDIKMSYMKLNKMLNSLCVLRSSTKSSPADTSTSSLCLTACSPSLWTVSITSESPLRGSNSRTAFFLFSTPLKPLLWLDDFICHSLTVSEESVHGGGQQVAPPAGGLYHTLVPLLLAPEPSPGLLSAGGLQQHNSVSVWWWDVSHRRSARQVSAEPSVNHTPPHSAGNFNLVYAIIRKRSVFHHLANLPSDAAFIQKALQRNKKSGVSRSKSISQESTVGSRPAVSARPGTLKASLEATPGMEFSYVHNKSFYFDLVNNLEVIWHPSGIDKITEKAQVSQDGTMVAVPRSESLAGATAGASDTESNSERDTEVHMTLRPHLDCFITTAQEN